MTESENPHLSFDKLSRSVAELHEKIDCLTGMFDFLDLRHSLAGNHDGRGRVRHAL